MKRSYVLIGIVCLMVVGSLWWVSTARAAPEATYELVKSYVGGSGSVSNGAYNLSSSIGQSGAGQVGAGIYTLGGGFWGGGVVVSANIPFRTYLPLVIK